jgi:hypothetical protein
VLTILSLGPMPIKTQKDVNHGYLGRMSASIQAKFAFSLTYQEILKRKSSLFFFARILFKTLTQFANLLESLKGTFGTLKVVLNLKSTLAFYYKNSQNILL